MDLRVMDEVADFLGGAGKEHQAARDSIKFGESLRDQYDHVSIAGASLGVTTPLMPHWNQTFWDHVDLAVKLHGVKRLVIVEHQDCGAYRAFVLPAGDRAKIGATATKKEWIDAAGEKKAHLRLAKQLAKAVDERGYGLAIDLLYAELESPSSAHAKIRRLDK